MDKRVFLVFAAVLAGLALAGSAAAALEVRLAVVPSSPKVGTRTVIQLRPYWPNERPDGSCCRLEPADTNYPFTVEAVSPAGRVFRIVVRRTTDPFVWAGSFVFRRPGRWIMREPHWGPRYRHAPGARPRIAVRVR
jgi:hypothetical protein